MTDALKQAMLKYAPELAEDYKKFVQRLERMEKEQGGQP